ncbi:MAG: bifunctional precorrin-2 dehydrogenase/sirohydrochlorin ferrochelatase [Rikenellaceae bacterium]|jgi:siroheme synthase-like protein|nr:bifunctional precorrin-2 dehydrogenase/sirohydrochlorin ferrochelatase [Rikenellaceae bacterium]
MKFLPVSLAIDGRWALLVGGGRVALHKARILSGFGCRLTVVSPSFADGFEELGCTLLHKPYEVGDVAGATLVYACTGDATLNATIRDDCRAARIPVSVCDSPDLCDFISPVIYRLDNVTVSVSSDGLDVRRSIRIRDRIRRLIEDGILSTN